MRWVTFRDGDGERTGVLSGDAIHVVAPGVSLLELIGHGAAALQEVGEDVLRSAPTVSLDQVTLAAPIPRPPSIRDSLCFLEHMRNCQAAMGGGRVLKDTWYRIPAFYFACPSTVLGPYDDAPMAPGSAWQDFELEIAAVIGTAGKDFSVAEAEQAIIGYMIFNDWSARDLQMLEGQLAIGQAKGKDSGVTLGPYLVTPDELEPYRRDGRLNLEVTALVNDEVIGTGSTAAMDWSFAEVIAYASRGVMLTPGEVFGSGTVPTCTLVEHLDAAAPESFRGWLHDGDIVTLKVQGTGRDSPNCPQNPCAATNPTTAQSRCRARSPAGQRGAGENPVHPRAARGRRPSVGLDAAGRRIRLEQRRTRRRRRRFVTGRHPVRPAADPRNAGRDGSDHRPRADHRRADHPLQR